MISAGRVPSPKGERTLLRARNYTTLQSKIKGASLTESRFRPNFAAMTPLLRSRFANNNFLGNRQSCAGSAAIFVRCVKALEDAKNYVEVLLANANAAVLDIENNRLIWVGASGRLLGLLKANINPFFRLVAVLDSIGYQVIKHLPHPNSIAANSGERSGNANVDFRLLYSGFQDF